MKEDFIIFYYYSEEFLINLHYIRKQWKSTNLSLLLASYITLMIPTNITFCFYPLPRRTFLFILCSACPFAHILNFLLYRLRTLVQQIAADSGRRRKRVVFLHEIAFCVISAGMCSTTHIHIHSYFIGSGCPGTCFYAAPLPQLIC